MLSSTNTLRQEEFNDYDNGALTTVQENPTLPGSIYGAEAMNGNEGGYMAGTPYSVQIQMYSDLLQKRQRDFE